MDDDVGLIALALVHLDVDLGVVFVTLAQAAFAEDARQHHLTPVALLLAVALEGAGQRRRLLGHAGVELGQALQFELEAVALGRLLGVGLPHLAAKAFQLLFQRSEQQIQAVLVQFAEVARVLLEDAVGEVLELLAEALFSLLLQLQLLGGGQPLAAQGGLGILETGGELDEQCLLLIQLLLAQQPLILQLVITLLQRLQALLAQQQFPGLRRTAAPPDPPTNADGQQRTRQQQGPEPGLDHLRPLWRRNSSR